MSRSPSPHSRFMSRRGGRKRKEDEALIVSDDEDDERKDDKRSKGNEAAASSSSAAAAAGASPARPELAPSVAASSSPAAAAAASSSSPPAAASSADPPLAPSAAASSSSPAAAAASSSSRPPAHVEDVKCGACWEPFTCADDSAHLPRTVPCGHLLCTACIRQNLALTPGSVPCPLEHGPQRIRIPVGSAAAAMSSVDDWIRLLPPANELIAAIRNQQSLMTRIGQQGARCSRPGCDAAVTHYCSDCPGDLCSEHERTRHTVFSAHKAHTMSIALKAGFLRDQTQGKLAGPAAEIRARAGVQLKQLQQEAQRAVDARLKLEQQLQEQISEAEAKTKAFLAQQQIADRMRAADDETVLEIEVERLDAQPQPAVAARPAIDSAVLNALSDERVVALQVMLGPERPLSKGTLLFRASRDGFAAMDWRQMCCDKSNTLTIVRVKGNGFVFGAFAPFQWPPESQKRTSIADPTCATFLFSLINAHNRAVKLRLKEDCKHRAGRLFPGSGPRFGDGDWSPMYILRSADGRDGNVCQPESFEFDSVADGGAPIAYDKTLLAGDDAAGNSLVYFAAAEIETWQL